MGRDALKIRFGVLKQPKITRKYYKDGQNFVFLFDGMNFFDYIKKELDKHVKI